MANFLSEYIEQIFPKCFLEGKNKKVFNKKLLAFVRFNRFETFTRIQLLDGLDTDKMSWLSYKCDKEHV